MLELLSKEILCHVVAVDGWNPSLIASMADLSRHMEAMVRCHVWPAYCYWRSEDVTRELVEGGVSTGGKGGKYEEIFESKILNESDTYGKLENESQNEIEDGGKCDVEGDMERDMEREREREREREKEEGDPPGRWKKLVSFWELGRERERERGEPPGGWIVLARILSFCPGSRDGGVWTDDVDCGLTFTRVKEGEGLLFNSSDVIFQSKFHDYHLNMGRWESTCFVGIIKDFPKSRILDMVEKINEREEERDEKKMNETGSVLINNCHFCSSNAWNVSEEMKENENWKEIWTDYRFHENFAFVCSQGHFYGGFTRMDNHFHGRVTRRNDEPVLEDGDEEEEIERQLNGLPWSIDEEYNNRIHPTHNNDVCDMWTDRYDEFEDLIIFNDIPFEDSYYKESNDPDDEPYGYMLSRRNPQCSDEDLYHDLCVPRYYG